MTDDEFYANLLKIAHGINLHMVTLTAMASKERLIVNGDEDIFIAREREMFLWRSSLLESEEETSLTPAGHAWMRAHEQRRLKEGQDND